MGEPAHKPPPGFDDMPVEQQVEYLQFLWDRIAAHPDQVPVPDWHLEVIGQRLADLDARPEDSSHWDDVEARLRAGLSKRG
jgi:putative addiction module component (TIGR02574 family)